MSRTARRFLGSFLLALFAFLAPAKAEIVYDNTLGVTTNYYLFSREYGDDINLAGSARSVNEFTFRYFGKLPSGVTSPGEFRIRFYENSGSRADPSSLTSQRPGRLIWESGLFPVQSGVVTSTLSVPDVLVPDRFTWTVEFSNLAQQSGNGAGLILANPPTIGALLPGRFRPVIGSYSDFWVEQNPNNPDSWALQIFSSNPDIGPQGNFYVRVSAVPEPSVVALAALGVAGLGCLVRRSRKS